MTNITLVKLTSISSSNTLVNLQLVQLLQVVLQVLLLEIINTAALSGSETDTLYVKYEKTGSNNTSFVFSDGETITGTNSDSVVLSV